MNSKLFVHQRICIYAGEDIDPNSDLQVREILKTKFRIFLPQRRSMNESLDALASDHEIIGLLKKYRSMG